MTSHLPEPRQDILVVVPCLNEERTLASVLDQILADSQAQRFFVAVADGGSDDLSRQIVDHYTRLHPSRVALVDNPGRFQSAAVNAAVRRYGAEREWLVRLDAHCLYPSDYVSRLVAAAQEREADTVVVPMMTIGHGCLQKGIAAAQNSRFGTGGSAHRHPGRSLFVDHGHHALFRMDKYLAVDGYDDSFSHNEDAELDKRLTDMGCRIWLQGDLAITYIPRPSFPALFSQYFAYGRGRARTVLRHKMRLRLRQTLPLFVPLAILALGLTPLTPFAAVPAAVWAGACIAAGVSIGLRRGRCCAVWAGGAFIVMHSAWGLGFWSQVLGLAPKRPSKGVSAKPAPAETVLVEPRRIRA